ncbi:c-type cytochrome [Pontibacter toksunensis]|uniref:C-type cytochrome n=1 Tax=Pontibacter toksunensis TaxID=1332631 RepID=A0ABW6BM23_9BACT
MKKIWMVISCCTFMAACGSSETTEGEEYYNRDNIETAEETPVYSDANSEAEVSAATKQSEVDTSINEIGTDREPEVATAPATTTGAATANTSTDAAKTPAAKTTAAKPAAVQENYDKGKNLIATSDCLACHKVDQKLVGPAYQEVAAKYEFNDKNIDYLAGKIIEGGAGVWGQIPMSPHPDLSRDNAKEMAKYILSLKK